MPYHNDKLSNSYREKTYIYIGHIYNNVLWLQRIGPRERDMLISRGVLPGIFFKN